MAFSSLTEKERITGMTDEAKIIQLAKGIFVRQAIDNITWADMGEYAIVVDALEQPELADEIFRAIHDTIGKKPVRYVLNTHIHPDHVALHQAFIAQGAQVVAHERAKAKGIPPNSITFDRVWHANGNRRVEMHAVGPCHTSEDAVIFFPDDAVLCAGDIFGWGLIPAEPFRVEAKETVLEVYRKLINFAPRTIVPGHGPLVTVEDLCRWQGYFIELIDRVTRLKQAGKDDAEIKRELPPPDDMRGWWRFVQWKHDWNIDQLLRALRHTR
jgi:cyclase